MTTGQQRDWKAWHQGYADPDSDLTPQIRSWCREAEFDEVGFDYEEGGRFGVGTHVFRCVTTPFDVRIRFFEFEPRADAR